VRAPVDGPATWAMGSLFERLASAAETDRAFDVSLMTQPPDVATPLHVHTYEARGILSSRRNHELPGRQHAPSVKRWLLHLPAKGRAARLPCHRNLTGPIPWLAVPAGLMDLYDEVGMPATERRLPGRDGPSVDEEIRRWNEVSPRYGLRVVGPPIPSET
jgi:hypothetical protein